MFTDAINWIIDAIVGLVETLFSIFPDSPFQKIELPSGFENFIAYANYVIPFGAIIKFGAIYLAAVLLWYALRWALRLVQYID